MFPGLFQSVYSLAAPLATSFVSSVSGVTSTATGLAKTVVTTVAGAASSAAKATAGSVSGAAKTTLCTAKDVAGTACKSGGEIFNMLGSKISGEAAGHAAGHLMANHTQALEIQTNAEIKQKSIEANRYKQQLRRDIDIKRLHTLKVIAIKRLESFQKILQTKVENAGEVLKNFTKNQAETIKKMEEHSNEIVHGFMDIVRITLNKKVDPNSIKDNLVYAFYTLVTFSVIMTIILCIKSDGMPYSSIAFTYIFASLLYYLFQHSLNKVNDDDKSIEILMGGLEKVTEIRCRMIQNTSNNGSISMIGNIIGNSFNNDDQNISSLLNLGNNGNNDPNSLLPVISEDEEEDQKIPKNIVLDSSATVSDSDAQDSSTTVSEADPQDSSAAVPEAGAKDSSAAVPEANAQDLSTAVPEADAKEIQMHKKIGTIRSNEVMMS